MMRSQVDRARDIALEQVKVWMPRVSPVRSLPANLKHKNGNLGHRKGKARSHSVLWVAFEEENFMDGAGRCLT